LTFVFDAHIIRIICTCKFRISHVYHLIGKNSKLIHT